MYKRARELILSSTNLVNSNPGASKSGDSSSGPNEDNDFDIIEPVTKFKVLFDSINKRDVQKFLASDNGFNDNFTCNILSENIEYLVSEIDTDLINRYESYPGSNSNVHTEQQSQDIRDPGSPDSQKEGSKTPPPIRKKKRQ